MTRAERRREREFFLAAGRAAATPRNYRPYLCNYALDTGPGKLFPARKTAIWQFQPDTGYNAFWCDEMNCTECDGNNNDRILAACFLAAMAEAGDLDAIYDGDGDTDAL